MLCVKRHPFKRLNVTEEMKTGLIFRSKRRHLTAAVRCAGVPAWASPHFAPRVRYAKRRTAAPSYTPTKKY